MRAAAIQMVSGNRLEENLQRAGQLIARAVAEGAQEFLNCIKIRLRLNAASASSPNTV